MPAANILAGGDGNDTLQGLGGADALQGGNGTDTASYAASAAAVTLGLTSNTATGDDAQGDSFSSIGNIIGSAFADVINDQAGANISGRRRQRRQAGGPRRRGYLDGRGRHRYGRLHRFRCGCHGQSPPQHRVRRRRRGRHLPARIENVFPARTRPDTLTGNARAKHPRRRYAEDDLLNGGARRRAGVVG